MSDDAQINVPKVSPMLRRLLNIASIVCFVLCVALMGMCVRSYWRWDQYGTPDETVISDFGQIYWCNNQGQPHSPRSFESGPAEEEFVGRLGFLMGLLTTLGFGMANYQSQSVVVVPYWFVVLGMIARLNPGWVVK